jgi:hypothetical protein
MNYPILAIEPRGFTMLLHSEAYWTSLPLGFIGIYKKRLDVLVFYGKDGNKWHLRSIALAEPIGLIRRLFGLRLGLSERPVPVVVEFQPAGPYTTEELRADLRSAVEADDDILCQYHAKEQILAWLEQAKSIARIFNLYNWITREYFRKKGPKSQRRGKRGA